MDGQGKEGSERSGGGASSKGGRRRKATSTSTVTAAAERDASADIGTDYDRVQDSTQRSPEPSSTGVGQSPYPAGSETRANAEVRQAPKVAKRRKSKKYTPQEALTTATTIMGVVELFAVSQLGEEARYNDAERAALLYGLTQMFENASIHVVEGAMSILWPGALLVGSTLYLMRVWGLYRAQHPSEPEFIPPPPTMPAELGGAAAYGRSPNSSNRQQEESWLKSQVTRQQRGVL